MLARVTNRAYRSFARVIGLKTPKTLTQVDLRAPIPVHDVGRQAEYISAFPGITDGWFIYSDELATGTGGDFQSQDIYQILESNLKGFERSQWVVWVYDCWGSGNETVGGDFVAAMAGIQIDAQQDLVVGVGTPAARVVWYSDSFEVTFSNSFWGSDPIPILNTIGERVLYPIPVFPPGKFVCALTTNATGTVNVHVDWLIRILPRGVAPV